MTQTNPKGSVQVKVDSDGCISCGACVAICENIFEFNEQNKSIVKKQPSNEEEIQCAKEAANACPVMVIHVEEIKAANNADYKWNNSEQEVA